MYFCMNLCKTQLCKLLWLVIGKSDLLIIFSWQTAKNMKYKRKLCLFSNVFNKADCFQKLLCIYNLFSYRQKAHSILQIGDCLKIFNYPHNNALWRHILTGYDFYSSVNWNNLVTMFKQKFPSLLYPLMLDIIVSWLVEYNMQYGLSAKR